MQTMTSVKRGDGVPAFWLIRSREQGEHTKFNKRGRLMRLESGMPGDVYTEAKNDIAVF